MVPLENLLLCSELNLLVCSQRGGMSAVKIAAGRRGTSTTPAPALKTAWPEETAVPTTGLCVKVCPLKCWTVRHIGDTLRSASNRATTRKDGTVINVALSLDSSIVIKLMI